MCNIEINVIDVEEDVVELEEEVESERIVNRNGIFLSECIGEKMSVKWFDTFLSLCKLRQ